MIDPNGRAVTRGAPTLEIELLGSVILRQPAEPVAVVDDEVRTLAEAMFETMYASNGQGLAAPQVGRSIRLAVVDVPFTGQPYVLINPRITAMSHERTRGVEGCLSVPGVHGTVERSAAVVVEALGLDGECRAIEAEGELARCLQHEIDHLDGILYIDRLPPLERALVVTRYRKRRGDDRIRTGSVPTARA